MEFNYNHCTNAQISSFLPGVSSSSSTIKLSLALEDHLNLLFTLNKNVGLGLNDKEINALAQQPIPILTPSQIPQNPVQNPHPIQIVFSPPSCHRNSVLSKSRRKIMEKQCKKVCGSKEHENGGRERILFNICEPAPCFSGRESFLQDLHADLNSNQQNQQNQQNPQNHHLTVLSQPQTESSSNGEPQCKLNGVIDGGTGKSETVQKYISQYKDCYKNIIWLNAESHHSLVYSFVKLAGKINVKTAGQHNFNTVKLVSAVYTKLNQNYECDCESKSKKSLLVFDNALNFSVIESFLPNFDLLRGQSISILITSRNPCWSLEREKKSSDLNLKILKLPPFEKWESVKFLMEGIQLPDHLENRRDSEELADLLCGSPLALNLAVAYIKELWLEAKQFFGFDYKVSNYTSKWKSVLEKQRQKNRLEFSSPSALIYFTTLIVTLQRLRILKHGEVAIKILQALAFLSPGEISLSFLLSLLRIEEPDLKSGVNLLEKFSLVSFAFTSRSTNPDSKAPTSSNNNSDNKMSIRIHNTLQIIILQQLEDSGEIFPVCENLVKNCTALLSRTSVEEVRKNVEIILHFEHILSDPLFTFMEKCDETSLNLIYVFGRVLFDVGGAYRESSLKYFKQLYTNCEQLFGENHKRTIVAEYDVAYVIHTLEKQGYLQSSPSNTPARENQPNSEKNRGNQNEPQTHQIALELLSKVMKKAGIHLGLTHQLTVSARRAIISILNERDKDKDKEMEKETDGGKKLDNF